jgi:hypothetical protein
MALGKIKADTLEHSTAGSLDTQYVVNGSSKAWVNYSGSGTTFRDSLNMSSATDNGTGDYTHAFTSNMGNVNYAIGTYAASSQEATDLANRITGGCIKAAASHRQRYGYINATNGGIATYDAVAADILFNGDLA